MNKLNSWKIATVLLALIVIVLAFLAYNCNSKLMEIQQENEIMEKQIILKDYEINELKLKLSSQDTVPVIEE